MIFELQFVEPTVMHIKGRGWHHHNKSLAKNFRNGERERERGDQDFFFFFPSAKISYIFAYIYNYFTH